MVDVHMIIQRKVIEEEMFKDWELKKEQNYKWLGS